MGTPDFAVPILASLRATHDVVAVYSRPDRPSGRGRKVGPTPVKAAALAAGLVVRQPERFSDPAEVALLAADAPDVVVVAAFGAILPRAVLDVPRFGCINVHASLLPRWRGAAPVQRAILAGDAETGVSIMRMEEGLDTGPWCAQQTVSIGDKDAAQLEHDLSVAGACLVGELLAPLAVGGLTWHAQDDAAATYAAKVRAEDVAVGPDLTVADFLARVRASGASAPCRMRAAGKNLTILRAERVLDSATALGLDAGDALCSRHLDLGCADGAVRVLSLVPEGRSAMSADAFIRGARLTGTCDWEAR